MVCVPLPPPPTFSQLVSYCLWSDISLLQVSPAITPQDRQYSHHMLAYFCPAIASVGYSGGCDGAPIDIRACRGINVFGSWAVGGEVCEMAYVHCQGGILRKHGDWD